MKVRGVMPGDRASFPVKGGFHTREVPGPGLIVEDEQTTAFVPEDVAREALADLALRRREAKQKAGRR